MDHVASILRGLLNERGATLDPEAYSRLIHKASAKLIDHYGLRAERELLEQVGGKERANSRWQRTRRLLERYLDRLLG